MNVIVGYAGGTTLCYSLNAFNAWEGYQVAFNGTKGRLEHSAVENAMVAGASARAGPERVTTRIIPMRGAAREIEPRMGEGDHGGGDAVMLADIFEPDPAPRSADPLGRRAQRRGLLPDRHRRQPLLRNRPAGAHRQPRHRAGAARPAADAAPQRSGADAAPHQPGVMRTPRPIREP